MDCHTYVLLVIIINIKHIVTICKYLLCCSMCLATIQLITTSIVITIVRIKTKVTMSMYMIKITVAK